MDKRAFGNRLRQARLEKNFTSDLLAKTCGINSVFVRQIESGIKLPSVANLVNLCNILEVSPAFLLRDNLKFEVNEQLDELIERMKALSPKELNLITIIIISLITNLENE